MTRGGARARLLLTALLFSTGGAAIKATTLAAWQVSCFRSAVAAVAVWLLVPAARRRWTWRMLPVGLAFAATMLLFVAANKLTTAANAIYLQSTSPLWVLLAGPLVLRERATREDLAFMGVVAVGMMLFFVGADRPQLTAPDPTRGNVLALVSGVGYAGVVLGLRWLGREEAIATVVVGNVLASVIALPLALGLSGTSAVHLPDALTILYLGVVQIGLAYFLMSTAMAHVPAIEASTILLVEPALNPLWAWLVHGERPAALSIVGGALIIVSAAGKALWDARRERSRLPLDPDAGKASA